MRVDLTTDDYPEDISWEIMMINGDAMEVVKNSNDKSYARQKTYVEDFCLSSCAGVEYVFNIYDSWGDGLTVGDIGLFMVFLGEDRIMGRSDGKDYEGGDSVKIFLNNTCPRDADLDTLRTDTSSITPGTDLGVDENEEEADVEGNTEEPVEGNTEEPTAETNVKPTTIGPKKSKKGKSVKGRLRLRKAL